MFLTKRKRGAKYRWCTCRWWQIALIPLVSSSGMTFANMVSVPTEEHNIPIHTSPLIPQVMPTRLTLRGHRCIRYKNVFTSIGSDHKTFLGLHMSKVRGRDSSHVTQAAHTA
jgi:hypothetical protein